MASGDRPSGLGSEAGGRRRADGQERRSASGEHEGGGLYVRRASARHGQNTTQHHKRERPGCRATAEGLCKCCAVLCCAVQSGQVV